MRLAIAGVLVVLVAVAAAPRIVAEGMGPASSSTSTQPPREYGYGLVAIGGHGAEWWRWQLVLERRHAKELERDRAQLRRELRRRFRDDSIEALRLSAIAYRVDPATLIRKADCETGGTFSPFTANRRSGAGGLLQFLSSTWTGTPYASFSRFSPYASALAGAWMHSVGRGGEWSCR